jgi:hypothetical protein
MNGEFFSRIFSCCLVAGGKKIAHPSTMLRENGTGELNCCA